MKIESPSGDPLRHQGLFPNDAPDPDASAPFLHFNTGKRGVTLDIETATGQRLFSELAQTADVVIETFQPGYLDRLEIGYTALSASHPEIVMVSITPFGQEGPYSMYSANELVLYAMSGYMSVSGEPDREPHKAHGEQLATHAGYQAALACLVAVTNRDLRGNGQHVDVAQVEAGAFLCSSTSPNAFRPTQKAPRRNGARLMARAAEFQYPSTLRPCKDGWVHVHANTRHPELLSELMDSPRLRDPEVLATPTGHADEIDAIMDEWLSHHDKYEVVRRAQSMHLHFTEVLTPQEVLDDEAHKVRDYWFTYEHPSAGTITQPGPLVRMSATPWVSSAAPALGEHNIDVFCDELGYGREELQKFKDDHIV